MRENDKKASNNNEDDNNLNTNFGILLGVIKWMDSWKKLGIFLVLFCTIGSGYFLYSNKDIFLKLFEYFSDGRNVVDLNVERVDLEMESIIKDTHADMASVWDMNRKENLRVLRYLMVDGQRIKKLEGISDIMLRARSEPSSILIDLLNETTVCFYLSTASEVGDFLTKSGIFYFCAVTIPPDRSFINGLVMIGFRNRPTNQDYIKQRLRIASDRIIK